MTRKQAKKLQRQNNKIARSAIKSELGRVTQLQKNKINILYIVVCIQFIYIVREIFK